MAIQENAKLRQLVNDYYHGLITPESYRSQRASLLDNIGADPGTEKDVTATRPRAEKPAPAAPPPAKPAVASESSATGGAKKLVIGVVVIAGIAVAGYLALSFLGEPGTRTDIASSGDSAESAGAALVDGFLTKDDWTRESLGNFLLAWEALDDSQRSEVLDGRQYRRLTAQLHQRIREETALGTDPDNRHLAALIGFAETIGAPYRQTRAGITEEPAVPVAEPVSPVPADEVDTVAPATSQAELPAEEPDPSEGTDEPDIDVASAGQGEAEVETAAEEPPPAEDADEAIARSDPCPAALAETRRPYCRDALSEGGEGPTLVVLQTGAFQMGSDRFEAESPIHSVDIARPLAMSVYEVSVQEYLKFCIATGKDCPASQPVEDAPVVSVTWDDATRYADWLTKSSGFNYRLPTEAEWEYAARAGTETPYSFGDEITPSAAHWSESGSIEAPLARSERGVNRNPFRLYHMSGNVREWVQDSWFDDYEGAPSDGSARIDPSHARKVLRGGSFLDPASSLRSAAREPALASHRDAMTGFRVVREIDDNSMKNNGE